MRFQYDNYGSRKPKPTREYKSKLESVVADWLTNLKIPFVYEPETYRTKIGNYTPDFYLTQINTYIEVKPKIMDCVKESYTNLLKQFSKEKKADVLLLTPSTEFIYYEYHATSYINNQETNIPEIWQDNDAAIGKCSKCNTIFFTSNVGWYNCRHCNTHKGDHDLINNLLENWLNYKMIWYEKDFARRH